MATTRKQRLDVGKAIYERRITKYEAARQLKLEGHFTPYASTDGTTFINNFEKYVVPSLDNVEVNERGEPVK